ncbi:MAG: hypothetical protein C5B47_04350 [Verrucomicrobia bacterium]|nr:MAG: hypothetical protein C5B47_04350 [Verrucomicrobiota bacterium]
MTIDQEDNRREKKVLFMAAISVGALMNLSIGTLMVYLKLPIYINALGTLLIAILLGIRSSICVGVLSTLLTALLVYPLEPYYVGTQITLSIVTGLMARNGFFRSISRTILTGILLGIIAAIASAPVTVYLFGGVPDFCCVSAITLFLLSKGYSLFLSVLGSYIVVETADKVLLCLFVLWLIRGFPQALRHQFVERGYLLRNLHN